MAKVAYDETMKKELYAGTSYAAWSDGTVDDGETIPDGYVEKGERITTTEHSGLGYGTKVTWKRSDELDVSMQQRKKLIRPSGSAMRKMARVSSCLLYTSPSPRD